MSILRLPPNVLYDVFVALQNSSSGPGAQDNLREFAVVHSSWRDPAERVLDRVLAISGDDRVFLRGLAKRIGSSSIIANRARRTRELTLTIGHQGGRDGAADILRVMPNLRVLRIMDGSEEDSKDRRDARDEIAEIGEAFEGLKRLRTLELDRLPGLAIGPLLMNAVSRISDLHTLALDGLHATDPTFDWNRCSGQRFPPIRRLSLTNITFDDTEILTNTVSALRPSLLDFEIANLRKHERGTPHSHRNFIHPDEIASAVDQAGKSETGLRALWFRFSLGLV